MSTGSNVDPVARVVADSHGLDATLLSGTGPRGVVTVDDVLAIVELRREVLASQAIAAAPTRPTAAPAQPAENTPLTDAEASACLWRLGIRAGLSPPVATVRPCLANEDGTAWTLKKT